MKEKNFYILFILIIGIYFGFNEIKKDKNENHKEMIQAKKNVKELFNNIKKKKKDLDIKVDLSLDINNSGVIGEEFTGLTTTLGDIDSKRLSTNTNFAAYFIKKLKECKLKEGDIVAVNMSSSFPGLNLSLISALDTLKLKGVIINSIGSSMYGANNEELTFIEMTKYLEKKGKIKNSIKAYSFGGDFDMGGNFDEDIKNKIVNRIKVYNLKDFSLRNIKENLEKRRNYYKSFGQVKYFINIGGNIFFSSLEDSFQSEGVPTLSMLNIKAFGSQLGLSIKEDINNFPSEIFGNKNYIKDFLIIIIFILGVIKIKMGGH